MNEEEKAIEFLKNKTTNYSLSGEELHYYLILYYLIINLQKENNQLKEYLERYEALIFNLKEQLERSEKARKEAIDKLKTLGKFDGEKCTRSFKLWTADFNELISILDIDKGE